MTSVQRNYRGQTPQERQSKRRAALLEAALDTVSDTQVEVSVRAICAKAGLTPRYFYENFVSLEELLVALVGQVGDEIFAAGSAAVLEVFDQPLLVQARAAFTGGYAVLAADERRAKALLVLASGHDVLQERRRRMVLDFTEAMLEFFGEQYDLSRIDPVHARTTMLFAVAGCFELMLAYLGGALVISEERLADEVAVLLAQCISLLGLPIPR
jgi:AcrR family transcriptional regulator